ncbi:MAG: HEAT repeat domain-containing protein [Proteobacteria bacterium]|nr:HEAT repeat domain-containing protein [Pseudomonadota bacterium]
MNRKIKKQVLAVLAGSNLETIRRELGRYEEHGLVNPLFSALLRPEEMLRWHTVTLFGEVVSRLADKDMEAARIVMRRFLWSLNDESGGIGWGAPEAMAETMYHHDRLCDEYLHMLISYMLPDGPLEHQDGNFLELPELQRGLLWGIGRLAEKRAALLVEKQVVPSLLTYLSSADAAVRGLAARALRLLKAVQAVEEMKQLEGDERKVRFYHEGEIIVTTVGELAGDALVEIKNSQEIHH